MRKRHKRRIKQLEARVAYIERRFNEMPQLTGRQSFEFDAPTVSVPTVWIRDEPKPFTTITSTLTTPNKFVLS